MNISNFLGWTILCGFCGVLVGIITRGKSKTVSLVIIAIYLVAIAALSIAMNPLGL